MSTYQLYAQLTNNIVYELVLKPITTRRDARDAVLSAKAQVRELGECALNDCRIRSQRRKAYLESLNQTSIWYERIS